MLGRRIKALLTEVVFVILGPVGLPVLSHRDMVHVWFHGPLEDYGQALSHPICHLLFAWLSEPIIFYGFTEQNLKSLGVFVVVNIYGLNQGQHHSNRAHILGYTNDIHRYVKFANENC